MADIQNLTLPAETSREPMLHTPAMLVDSFGRKISNLRISVTEICNLRCTYCMPEDVTFLTNPLSVDEIGRFARAAVSVGIDKIRLTGGEPLLRAELADIVRDLVAIDGVRDIGLTTNGMFLEDQAEALYSAGLRRLNVSLDTLDEAVFRKIARRDGLSDVIAGIDAAHRAGFWPIKINAVIMKGINDGELLAFAEMARDGRAEVRFIEFMPLDGDRQWKRENVLLGHQIVEQIGEVYPLARMANENGSSPATMYEFADGMGRIGIIPSVSEPFCDSCNRIRLTADGHLRTCLFSLDETNFRDLLSSPDTQSQITKRLLSAVWHKEIGHKINDTDFVQPERIMHAIGG